MTVGLKAWHLIVSHLGLVLIVALGLVAYWGWHRPPMMMPVVSKEVQRVPVGGTQPIVVTVPGVSTSVPQVVTAPTPQVRIITTPQPVVVSPPQQAAAEAKAPFVITVPLVRDCVHPDVQGLPDPTCGKPVDPTLTLVQSTSGGYVRLEGSSATMQTGPITTQVNHIAPPARVRPWSIGVGAIGVAEHSGFHGMVGPDLAYHRSLGFAEFTAVAVADIHGNGVGGLAMLNIPF